MLRTCNGTNYCEKNLRKTQNRFCSQVYEKARGFLICTSRRKRKLCFLTLSKGLTISITDRLTYIYMYKYKCNCIKGSEEVCAALRSRGIKVQRERCRTLLAEVDSTGTAARWSRTVQRRQYNVPMANSLWHLDSHHSLIR